MGEYEYEARWNTGSWNMGSWNMELAQGASAAERAARNTQTDWATATVTSTGAAWLWPGDDTTTAAAAAPSARSIGGVLGLILALLVVRACVFLRPRARDLDGKLLPGPPAALLMGNWADIKAVKTGRNFDSATRGMLELYQAHGEGSGIVCLRLFSKLIVMCHSPAAVKDVLTGSYDKFPKNLMYKNLEYALGKGLVTANGERWRAHRRIVEKAFHKSALHAMLPCFVRHTAEMLDGWTERLSSSQGSAADESDDDGQQQQQQRRELRTDVHTEMTHLTLDIIADSGFGYVLGSKRAGGSAHPLCLAVTTLINEMNMRFKDMNPLDRYLSPSRWLEANAAYKTVAKLVDDVLAEKQAEFDAAATAAAAAVAGGDGDEAGDGCEKKRRRSSRSSSLKDMSLLDHLLAARLEEGEKHLTPTELRDEVMTFLGAGHETTANMLSWTFYELSRAENLHILRNLQEELQSAGIGSCLDSMMQEETKEETKEEGGSSSSSSMDMIRMLGDCVYMDAICSESLRRYPVIPGIGRCAGKPITIAGRRFPKGTHIMCNIKALAHDPVLWPDPMTFQPERFLNHPKGTKGAVETTLFHSVPFSAGARSCIGKRFSLLEAKVILAMVLQRFEPHSPPPQEDVKGVEAITMRPKHGMPISFRLR
jgi:cytochrome P450